MLIEHEGRAPRVDPSAWVAPTATLCGDVIVGPESRVMFGANLIAGGGRITVGERCIVLENAVIRSTPKHETVVGDHCLIGRRMGS